MNKASTIFIVLGITVLAVVGYVLFKPTAQAPANIATNTPAPNNPAPTPQEPTPVEVIFNYTRTGYEPKSVRVEQGQQVVVKITSDSADEVHLHGYDLEKALVPGQTATIEFTADKTGRFDIELHEAEKPLGVIEVYPK